MTQGLDPITLEDSVKSDSALAIHVGNESLENLEIGIENGVWGFPGPQVAQLSIGDLVIFGGGVRGGPRQSRAKEKNSDGTEMDARESWFKKSASFLVLARATSAWYKDSSPIWDGDKTYEHRFNFELIDRFENVLLEPDLNLSAEASQSLRLAGTVVKNNCIQCQQFSPSGLLFLNIENGEIEEVHEEGSDFDPVDYDGELDATTNARARREQYELRKRLLRKNNLCAICGNNFPSELLVAAHIKKRSKCTDQEKRDLQNIAMLACKLGCDALYEIGYLVVNSDGFVQKSSKIDIPQNLYETIKDLVGNRCLAYRKETEQYFDWHRRSFNE